MIKIILTFIVIFALFFFGINFIRKMTGMQKWNLTKIAGYSIICSMLSLGAITIFVLLF